MLQDLILALVAADNDPALKDKAYRALERVGVDRRSADVMAAGFVEDSHGKG